MNVRWKAVITAVATILSLKCHAQDVTRTACCADVAFDQASRRTAGIVP